MLVNAASGIEEVFSAKFVSTIFINVTFFLFEFL